MNKKQFWQIIDSARKEGGNWHGIYEPLMDLLAVLDVPDIVAWYHIFDKYAHLSYTGINFTNPRK